MLAMTPYIILSIVLSLISMPIIIHICNKNKIFDYNDGRKLHSGNISRLGGVGIVFPFLISSLLYLHNTTTISGMKSLPILIAALMIFVLGFLDDLLTLPALVKLIVQLAAAGLVTFNGYRFIQIFGWILPVPVSYIITFCWIVGVINAYNLIDSLDGLCGSLSITAIITLGVLYSVSHNLEAGLCFILAGAIFGFLCFNWPPAKIFMGDDGSTFLGFIVATIPLYSSSDIFEYNKFLILIILTAFPVFDTIAAIWRRIRDRRPIMSPDKSHLHHKLLNIGYTKKQALSLIVFIQLLLCGLVILSYFIGKLKGTAMLLEGFIFMIIFFSVIHYTNRAINRKKEAEAAAAAEGKELPSIKEASFNEITSDK
ncbi:MAG: undecaprenyl/decaprenyl-phosphate alpha-N-acetylglucosaminyl 1-phosphate transferase [Treponema sp.]|nr:undecaprenyl/decaprenyl-phosphate alpha-N-acetylglucosaminyl 1-phosphate transferase [Treponema sp.]